MKNLEAIDFSVKQALAPFCKRTINELDNPDDQSAREIDYVALQGQLQSLHELQRRACQQIVDIVDDHLQTFVEISTRLSKIQQKLHQAEQLYNRAMTKVEECKRQTLSEEAKLQQAVENYEVVELEATLLEQAQEAIELLLGCSEELEKMKGEDKLTMRQKNCLIKFTWKIASIKRILSHTLVLKHLRQLKPVEFAQQLEKQFTDFLSQQLKKMVSQGCTLEQAEETIGLCFRSLGRQELYYAVIEQNLVLNELRVVETNLLSNKTMVMANQDQPRLESFFKNLFMLVRQLPKDYPNDRIIKLVNGFLSKKQFNFLYTYTLPLFPSSYGAYRSEVLALENNEVREDLLKSHKWNIKMWADFRVQQLSKPAKQSQDILKQLDNIFKKACLIDGVKAKMVKLALVSIAKLLQSIKAQKVSEEQYANTLNKLVEYEKQVPLKLKEYIDLCYSENDVAERVEQETALKFKRCIEDFLQRHIKLVVSGCINSLQSVNSILTKVVTNPNPGQIHNPANIFKTLSAHFRNNIKLIPQAQAVIKNYVEEQVKRRYQNLKGQIADYSARTLTPEQTKRVFEALESDKKKLFEKTLH